jgi:hypothetical protein
LSTTYVNKTTKARYGEKDTFRLIILEAATSPFLWRRGQFPMERQDVGGETSCDSDGVIVYLLVQGYLVPVVKNGSQFNVK